MRRKRWREVTKNKWFCMCVSYWRAPKGQLKWREGFCLVFTLVKPLALLHLWGDEFNTVSPAHGQFGLQGSQAPLLGDLYPVLVGHNSCRNFCHRDKWLPQGAGSHLVSRGLSSQKLWHWCCSELEMQKCVQGGTRVECPGDWNGAVEFGYLKWCYCIFRKITES